MPSVAYRSGFAASYTDPRDLPFNVLDALRSNERNSNCVYPKVLELLDIANRTGHAPSGNAWITYTSYREGKEVVDLIMSCTGRYPVFIVTPLPVGDLTEEFLRPRLEAMAHKLVKTVPVQRVYSVFSLDQITVQFVEIWSRLTGTESYADAYYAARISYCTMRSSSKKQMTISPELFFDLRPAVEEDIKEIAELCYNFAAESEPFVLTEEEALNEARQLVEKEQVWVHRVTDNAKNKCGVACIVAYTRNSDNNATITKVYTNPKWRRLGCAERLVRQVCKHLLKTKQTVALYVAHNNPAAIGVYHRCGFAGLGKDSQPVEGVDNWLEIGFDRSKVTLGHW